MPANVLQEIIGITVAVVICYACRLKSQLVKARLLPDFRREMLASNVGATVDEGTPADDKGDKEDKDDIEGETKNEN